MYVDFDLIVSCYRLDSSHNFVFPAYRVKVALFSLHVSKSRMVSWEQHRALSADVVIGAS